MVRSVAKPVLEGLDKMHQTIDFILSDEEVIKHMASQIFKLIDVNGDGGLESSEVIQFICDICEEYELSQGILYD